jgi:hypothetical protein
MRQRMSAHRVSLFLATGEDHPELEPDHLCNVKLCVNPAHLEWTTHAENMARATKRRTHCRRGHPFHQRNQFNQCIPCLQLTNRRFHERIRGAA